MAKKLDQALYAALASHGFPREKGAGLGFTPDDDELLRRGFPALRTLSEEAVPNSEARERALLALDAIDPTLEYSVPRSVASLYLVGYRIGPNLFDDPSQGPLVAARRAERLLQLEAPPAVDAELFRATLREGHCNGMGDTYGRWRFAEIAFLYEEFLGTRVVAELLVERLLELARDVEAWGFAGEKPLRTNAAPHHLALVLPWLLQRLPDQIVSELRAGLDAGPEPDPSATRGPTAYFELLKRLARPGAPPRLSLRELDDELALREPNLGALSARVEKQGVLFAPARVAWCLGTQAFARPFALAGHDAARLVLELGPLRDPGVVRLVAHLGAERAGQQRAAEWLARNESFARPVLSSLAELADKKEKAAAVAALALLDQGAPATRGALSEDEVESELAALFAALAEELAGKRSKRARVGAIQAAYERYSEVRSAGGHPVPEAYFVDSFADFGLGEWAALAAEAIGAPSLD